MHRLACLCLCGIAFTCSAESWSVTPGPAWTTEGSIVEPRDVSGLTVAQGDEGWLVSDETRIVQRFHLDRDRHALIAGSELRLRPSEGKEFDLEGIATSTDGRWVYTAGSHGVSRKSGKAQAGRGHVFRLSTEGTPKPEETSLMPVIEADKGLHDSIGKDAAHHGLDIEGLAECRGHLFFGLRSPNVRGHAFVVEVSAEGLFKDAHQAQHRTHALELGEGRGIRDLVVVSDGFLLIAGDTGDRPNEAFTLHHWAMPSGKLETVGTIPASTGKAEGLLLLKETPKHVRLLVTFDGVINGGPIELKLTRPGAQ